MNGKSTKYPYQSNEQLNDNVKAFKHVFRLKKSF